MNTTLISLYLLILSLYFFKYGKKMLIYWMILLLSTSQILGVYLIERSSNMYLYEINKTSYFKNSLWVLIFFYFLFISIIIRIDIKKEKIKIKNNRIYSYINILIIILLSIILICVIKKPIFGMRIDKYLYIKLYLNQYIYKIINIITYYFSFYMGVILFNGKKKERKKIILIIIELLLILALIGVKFGGYLYMLYFLSLSKLISINKIRKLIFKLSFGVLFLVIFSLSYRIFMFNLPYKDGINFLETRIAQQGQLWWSSYNDTNFKESFINELKSKDKNTGIYKVMYLVGEKSRIDMLHEIGVKYTSSTQSSLYKYYSKIGLFIGAILLGYGYKVFYTLLLECYIKNKLLVSIFILRGINLLNNLLFMSAFNKIFEIILLYIVIKFLLKVKEKGVLK